MNFNENRFINGDLGVYTRSKEDGTIIDSFEEHNVITAQGASEFLARLTKNDSTVNNSYVRNIVLGDDVGTGTLLNPQSANETYTSTNQTSVYTISNNDITVTYPDPFTFEFNTILDGTYILDTYFPSDIEMRFTSATLRYNNGKTLAFKRFPVRSLSRLVDIEIRWTVSLKEQV